MRFIHVFDIFLLLADIDECEDDNGGCPQVFYFLSPMKIYESKQMWLADVMRERDERYLNIFKRQSCSIVTPKVKKEKFKW